ncbi:phage portal protein [Alistipes putredinis]|uniref:phage portal protein n=1 Tax=Alistipes putredinis TaxID=28117 RepID=UPI003AB75D77
MKTLDEILALESEVEKIYYLQQRRTPLPDVHALYKDWDPDKHDVNDVDKRPENKIIVAEATIDPSTGKEIPAQYTDDKTNPTNRITLPLEQDITNIHTAWTVGKDPKVTCEPNNDKEQELLSIIKSTCRRNKMRYFNKRLVRSWLSETECAEYWYVVKDEGFWRRLLTKLKNTFGGRVMPQYRLKCALWSPFRGDKLYPFFNDAGDYLALSREYSIKEADGTETVYFMTVTDRKVYRWRMDSTWVKEAEFLHGFTKNPTIYSWRPKALCHNIRAIRDRLERLMSNFADCIDRHFFPYLIMEGDVHGLPQKSGKNRMIKITNGGKVYYLNWDQASDAVRLEMDELWSKAYQLTNTPQLSLEALKGLGEIPSGKAFQFLFMGTNLAVDNHAEVIGEHIQRRYNFLASAVGSLSAEHMQASQTIDIETEIQPYSIEDIAEKIKNATDACGQPIASLKTGVMMAGLVDNVDDEVREIEEENTAKSMTDIFTPTE